MTSNRKKSGNALPFHGVVVAGSTKLEAMDKYRNAILGTDAKVYVDEDKTFSFLSSAETGGMTLFNPSNGMLNLSKSESLTSKAVFVSESHGDLEANYTICSDGCGSHVIFDDDSAITHCPVCASDLEELTEDEINEMNDEDEEIISELEGDDDFEVEEISESSVDEDEDVEVSDIDDDEEDEEDDISESSSEEDLEVIMAMEDEDEDDEDDDEDEDEEDDRPKGDDVMDIEVVPGDSDEIAAESSADNYRGIVVTARTRDAVVARYKRILSGSERVFHEDIVSEDCIIASSRDSDINYNPSTGEPTMVEADQTVENIETVVASQESGDVEVNMMVCSSEECGHFTLSDGEMTNCAVCGCELSEPVAESGDDESVEELGDEPEDTEENTEGNEDEQKVESNVNLLASTMNRIDGGKLDPEKLDLAYCGTIAGDKRWQAFYEGVPVAYATANTAAKHANIFEGAAFANAVSTGARHIGVAEILDDMGFSPVVATVHLDRDIEAEANARFEVQASKLKGDFEQIRDEYVERFTAALATASQGINRGFFKNEHNVAVQNPIKTALWGALSSVGIAQPEVLIDSAYKAHSDDYHKLVIAKAVEIMGKPLEVQNELAKSVDETVYREAHASAVTTTIADKLAGVGDNATFSEPAQTVTASDRGDHLDMQAIVAGLGRRR
jgi:hypothetical protein